MNISELLKKSGNNENFTRDEIIKMLTFPCDSMEAYQIMAEANRISKELTGNKAEVHAQFALNLASCKSNCLFCSFAEINKIFDKSTELSVEEAVAKARQFENDEACAIFVMTSANYSFERFIEISQEIKKNIKKETILIANVGVIEYGYR